MSEAPHEFAWKVHSALDSWTAKVDSKASIVLGLETASIGFVVALWSTNKVFVGLRGTQQLFFRVGFATLIIGVVLAGLTVFPQLSRRRAKRIWKKHIIYFGHLRHWDPVDLEKRLKEVTEPTSLTQLSNQLVEMSKIAWRKHAWLQYSMLATFAGLALIALSTWR